MTCNLCKKQLMPWEIESILDHYPDFKGNEATCFDCWSTN